MVRKNIFTKVLATILLMSMVSATIAIPAKADNTERYDKSGQNVGNVAYNLASFDGRGNIIWATSDKVRTSSITYATTAITFSRITTSPGVTSAADLGRNRSTMAKENWDYYDNTAASSVLYNFNSSERAASYYDTSAGEYRNKDNYTISFQNIYSAIEASNPSWAAEIKSALSSGQHYYIKVDSVMGVYHNGNIKHLQNGQYLGNYFSNTAVNDATGYGILTEEGWANKDGLYTHFDIFIDLYDLYGLSPEQQEEIIPPIINPPTPEVKIKYGDHLVTTDSNDPGGNTKSSGQTYEDYVHFAAGNANSDGYDAAQGIPSNKTITGYAEAIPWYATTDIYARAVYRDYYPKYVYVWKGPGIGEKSYAGKADFPNSEDAIGQYVSVFNGQVDTEFQKIDAYDERFDTFNNTGVKGTAEFVHHHPELGGDFAKKYKLPGELKLENEDVTGQHDGRRYLSTNQNTGDFATDSYTLKYYEHTYKHHDSYIDLNPEPNDKEYVKDVEEDEYGDEIEIMGTDHDTVKQHEDKLICVRYTPESISGSGKELWGTEFQHDTGKAEEDSGESNFGGETESAGVTTRPAEFSEWGVRLVREIKDYVNGADKGSTRAYVAFEYIDPTVTSVYDFTSIELSNDAYESDITMTSSAEPDITIARGKIQDGGISEITSADSVLNKDHIIWAPDQSKYEDGTNGNVKPYETDAAAVQNAIFAACSSVNDYMKITYDTDQMTAKYEGEYLGKMAGGSLEIVKGCDFRDAKASGCTSLGNADEELGGSSNRANGLSAAGQAFVDSTATAQQKFSDTIWALCKNSAAKSTYSGGGNAYTEDRQNKLCTAEADTPIALNPDKPNKNSVWEYPAPDGVTVNLIPTTTNGKHYTDVTSNYSPIWTISNAGNKDHYASVVKNWESGQDRRHYLYTEGEFYDLPANLGDPTQIQLDTDTGNTQFSSWHNGAHNPADGSQYIVDPINVHTPIMAPATIRSSVYYETGPHDVNEDNVYNTGTTQLVDEHSLGDVAELRLDKWYILHWIDLSKVGDDHRDTASGKENRSIRSCSGFLFLLA